MVDFIVKYWVQVLFGLICAGIAWSFRHHIKLLVDARQTHEKTLLAEIDNKFKEQGITMQEKMDACYGRVIDVIKQKEEQSTEADKNIYKKIDTIRAGVLTIEGAWFKGECHKLLDPEHVITSDEFDAITQEHDGVYNKLGGNHEGDTLYNLVKQKYQTQIM